MVKKRSILQSSAMSAVGKMRAAGNMKAIGNMKAVAKSVLLMACAGLIHPVYADIEGSAGLASTYLFRGADRSDGLAQVYGDVTVRSGTGADSGLYLSAWASSAGNGSQEYDLIVGWQQQFDNMDLNIGAISYVHPGDASADNLGSEVEAYIGIAGGGFEAYLYKNVASRWQQNNGHYYLAGSYTQGRISSTLGYAYNDGIALTEAYAEDEGEFYYIHWDFSVAVSKHLSFTFSKMLSRDMQLDGRDISYKQYRSVAQTETAFASLSDDDMLFVATYSIPLEI
jgi:hypothetical protein